MTDKARSELAPTGVLRAGINLSNFLLVTGRSANAEPVGVSPDMARAAMSGHLDHSHERFSAGWPTPTDA